MPARKQILMIHAGHPGGRTAKLCDAVASGIIECGAECSLQRRHALEATLQDLLAAQGVLLGTPEHFGYMAGALKHFFDVTFYPGSEHTVGLPYGLFVSAGTDGQGTIEAVERIVTGYRWRAIAAPLRVIGDPEAHHLQACRELGATLAHGLESGIF